MPDLVGALSDQDCPGEKVKAEIGPVELEAELPHPRIEGVGGN